MLKWKKRVGLSGIRTRIFGFPHHGYNSWAIESSVNSLVILSILSTRYSCDNLKFIGEDLQSLYSISESSSGCFTGEAYILQVDFGSVR